MKLLDNKTIQQVATILKKDILKDSPLETIALRMKNANIIANNILNGTKSELENSFELVDLQIEPMSAYETLISELVLLEWSMSTMMMWNFGDLQNHMNDQCGFIISDLCKELKLKGQSLEDYPTYQDLPLYKETKEKLWH